MKRVALGEFMPSKIPSLDPSRFKNETFELWSIPSFDAGKPDIAVGDDIGSSKKLVEPDDVLLSRIVPHIRRSWVVRPNKQNLRQIASGEWMIFRGKGLYPDYLRHVLISDPFHTKFMQTVAGVGGSLLRARPDGVKEIKIPLPSLEEQKRIAAILDQADNLRRLRQCAINRLNTLGQSIFYEMFGNSIAKIPTEKLGNLTSKIGSGSTPRGGDASYKVTGIPFVRSMNVHDACFNSKGLAYIDDEQASKLDNVVLRENDVLLNITGASVARVCRAPASVSGGRVNQHVSIIRPTSRILAEFLESYLLFPTTKQKLLKIAEAGATRQAITKAQLEELDIPLPELKNQKIFVERLRQAHRLLEYSHLAIAKQEGLFASLQHRAFRGEL